MSDEGKQEAGERLARVTIYAVTAAVVLAILALGGAMVWAVVALPGRHSGPVTWPEAVRTGALAFAVAGAFAAWMRWRKR